LTGRDHDDDRDPSGGTPPEEPTADEAPDTPGEGPAPTTWAGRRRSSPEDPGEHDQPPAEETETEAESPAESDPPTEDDAEASETDEPAEEEPEGAEEFEEAEEAEDAQEPEEAEESAEAEDAGPDTEERLAQDTVEADTLSIADREAAREAALAGLRARAAEHGTKPGTEAITAPPPKKEEPADAKTDGHAQAEEAPPAQRPPVAVAAEVVEKPPKRGMWPRFAAGSLVIIVAIATATALSLLFFVNGFLDKFHGVPGVENELAVANPGQPQTFLILGSDARPEDQAIGARSDTTILLRIASDQISVLSIPRDLKVNIPGHGLDKFNAAYTYGGARLTLKVVKQSIGITDINHVVNVDFTGFADAVNAIGCVYVDVDHHYYHSNAGILDPAQQYAEIDISAGYQRLCGNNALQYVRYRHDDNDLVRAARQQEFLREVRQELPASRIASQYDSLVSILQKYVTLDIRSTGDLVALAQLIVAANGAPVVQVHFPATLGGPTDPYVTASDSAIKAAVAKFEGTTPTPVPGETTTSTSNGGSGGGSGSGSGSKSSGSSAPAPAPTLIDVSSTAQQIAATLETAKTEGGSTILHFPLYYPTRLAPDSTLLTEESGIDESRAFLIDGPGDEVYHGYKFVASMPTDGYTAYYGVSGTDWKDPPILDHPDETKTIDGRDYLLSWDGPELRLIGWKTDTGSYWVDNTLLNALTPGQMFAIAQSMQKYTG
jgi:LCP family protein required for cell wall assembly